MMKYLRYQLATQYIRIIKTLGLFIVFYLWAAVMQADMETESMSPPKIIDTELVPLREVNQQRLK